MTSNSGGNDGSKSQDIAIQFQRELNSLLEIKPPISKEKMGHIVKEAIKEIRHYKHVVYYVESFIKNSSSEYKIPGLYVIDAIIRNSKSQLTNKIQKDVYSNRFSKNMCKTFSNLYEKCPQSDREKITRVLHLWQKYNILDSELIEKLNRLSSIASIDLSINETLNNSNTNDDKDLKRLNYLQHKLTKLQESQKESNKLKIDDKLISEIHKLSSQLLNKTSPNTTKTEINKILDFENDLDSDSEINNNNNNSKSIGEETTVAGSAVATAAASIVFNEDTLNPSERFRKSIDNCTAWLKSSTTPTPTVVLESSSSSFKKINLPDLTQPPPPLSLTSLTSSTTTITTPGFNFNPPNPNSTSTVVDSILYSASKRIKTSSSSFDNDNNNNRERDRSRRGLPNIRDKHILICSKTIWLGHLSKTTTQDYVINELTDLLSPSSSTITTTTTINTNNNNIIIIDCQLIPPRGCAYVEFIDRKTASKCLERMKDGYRLDGNVIKVAWATNKGINKDNHMKSYWNVEVGCTFLPWSDLDTIYNDTNIDFIKWAEGGLIDEDSIPDKYLPLFKKQIFQLANTTTTHIDMDLDTEDNDIQQQQQQQTKSFYNNIQSYQIQPQSITLPLQQQQQQQQPPPPSYIQQIPNNLLNSDLLNHLRASKPVSSSSSSQIQFLAPPPPPPQPQDIQSAIAHFNQQSRLNDLHHIALLQQQQQQQHQQSLVPNPHLATHFQLVQRPLILPPQQQQQQHQFRNLNDPLQLLANQQQIRNILAANNNNNNNQQQFFLSSTNNNKIPQMLFLSESQFQEMNKQQQQQQSLGPTLVKSPVVSSTTTSYSDIINNNQATSSSTSSSSPNSLNPKPLMSFDLVSDSNNNESDLITNESSLNDRNNNNWKKRSYDRYNNNNNNKYYQTNNNRRYYNNNNEQKDQDFR